MLHWEFEFNHFTHTLSTSITILWEHSFARCLFECTCTFERKLACISAWINTYSTSRSVDPILCFLSCVSYYCKKTLPPVLCKTTYSLGYCLPPSTLSKLTRKTLAPFVFVFVHLPADGGHSHQSLSRIILAMMIFKPTIYLHVHVLLLFF